MKLYPSIPGIAGCEECLGRQCIAFEKIDGSNLRFEWSHKSGWYKFGTRQRLFNESDPEYSCAIPLFLETYGDSIVKAVKDSKIYRHAESIIAFCEFFGTNSFAGQHLTDDPKELTLFDVNIYKKGLLGPTEFLQTFSHLKIAEVIYNGPFDEIFINNVRESHYPVKEGVVAKGGNGANHNLWLCKVKTLAYLKELKQRYQDKWKEYWE